jgi:hypothetical protein
VPREQRIVARVDQKGRDFDVPKPGPAARANPVIVGVSKTIDGSGIKIIDFTESGSDLYRARVTKERADIGFLVF